MAGHIQPDGRPYKRGMRHTEARAVHTLRKDWPQPQGSHPQAEERPQGNQTC